MKKISVAILICLVIVLTISLAGCSNQDVNKLFGEQKELAFSLQELTGLNVEEGAIMTGGIDDFGLAVFRYTLSTTGKTYYTLFNFETNTSINTSTLEFIKINDGLYYQINEQDKYILTGAKGNVVSGVEGSVNGKEFYATESNTTYYVAPDGQIKTSSKAFEERVSYGDTYECGDYQEKEVSGGYKYYTQQGEYVGSLFPKVDFDLLNSAVPTEEVTIANKKIFQYLTPTYDDNENSICI
ncbi:MAG: hypothetical protein ACI4M5_03845 [Christensenellales bacterium]